MLAQTLVVVFTLLRAGVPNSSRVRIHLDGVPLLLIVFYQVRKGV